MANRLGRTRDTKKIGTTHGRLKIIEPTYKDGLTAWLCICSCGKKHVVKNRDLRNTKSCGCLRIDLGKLNKTHGMLKTPTYQAWHSMKQRCFNSNLKAWKNYGGRGITVCERWTTSFESFFEDMGEKPVGMSLDRIDNSKGYFPENCRWATKKTQCNNRRTNVVFVINGSPLTVSQMSNICGLSVQTLFWRIHKLKMTPEEAMNTPLLRKRKPKLKEVLNG